MQGIQRLLLVLLPLVFLAGCVSAPVEPEDSVVPLTNTYWKLEEVRGQPVPAVEEKAREAHMMLLDDGRVNGFSGCNRFMGRYQVEGSNLLFDAMGSTRMACPDSQTESMLFAAFANTVGVNLSGNRLRLLDEVGNELAVFIHPAK
jgi:heat shock protein HslJ